MSRVQKIFGQRILFCDYKTAKTLKAESELCREYKGHTIAFSKPWWDKDGHPWFRVRVYENHEDERVGAFAMRTGCATDGEAMQMALTWAKENIDAAEA